MARARKPSTSLPGITDDVRRQGEPMAKVGRKLTRKTDPAYAFVDRANLLRRIAGMYYTSDGENREPTRTPEPEVDTRGATERALYILGDMRREGRQQMLRALRCHPWPGHRHLDCLEDMRPNELLAKVQFRHKKLYPHEKLPDRSALARARAVLALG
jgi:hypothetical protein